MSGAAELINNGTTDWSNVNSWSTLTGPPVAGSNISFQPGLYVSILDTAFLVTSLGTIYLSTGSNVTLDVQKSVTFADITGSTDGFADQGLLEIGNSATVTDTLSGSDDFNSTLLHIDGDGLAEGLFVINGTIDNGSVITLNDVDFDSTVGISDTTAENGSVPADLTLENGAAWTASSTEVFNAGSLALAGGGIANLGAVQPGNFSTVISRLHTDYPQISMTGSNNELILPNTTDAAHVAITGFGPTDKIEIQGFTAKSANYVNNELSIFSGANDTGSVVTLTDFTLDAGAGPIFTTGTDALGSFVELASCFAAGTRILTTTGEVDVEDLCEGDHVITQTAGGATPVPVIWIGHRKLDLTRHPYPQMVAPIRIRRGALADNVPHRDLVLSPDHSIYMDGVLVPAKLLVNGRTIIRQMPDAVTYFHVECAAHTVILAEGLTVETYLDTGDRAMFDNAGSVLSLHPQLQGKPAVKTWADACAPLVIDAAVAQPIWQSVADRAARLGYVAPDAPVTSDDPGLRLLANGRTLAPIGIKEDKYVFVLPAGLREVTLLSDTVCPADERPWSGDLRRLGVAIQEIVLRGDGDCGNGDLLVLRADDLGGTRGWWPAENDGCTFWRWNDGAGVVPLNIVTRIMEVKILKMAHYPVARIAGPDVLAA